MASAEDARKKLDIEREKTRREIEAKMEQEKKAELARLEIIRIRE